MTERHRLAVIHPHRDAPLDIDYRRRVEAPNCLWCRWYDRHGARYRTLVSCQHRMHRSGCTTKDTLYVGRHDDWNRDGDCLCYEPSLWTLFLRIFGLRQPAWRYE